MKDRKNKSIHNKRIDIRVSDDMDADLKHMSFVTGKSRSEIVREALKLYKNIVKNQ